MAKLKSHELLVKNKVGEEFVVSKRYYEENKLLLTKMVGDKDIKNKMDTPKLRDKKAKK
tara:strand:- start:3665 stop:3841 length:177 start_codon:yes stop_codon:yes gene_type:complete